MTQTTVQPTILLIPGHRLGAWAWDEVREHLDAAGAHAVAMTLPGLDPDDPQRAARTLDDQVAAILDALARNGVSAGEPAIIVAHSGANLPVTLVLDRNPELVRRMVWVDSGPVAAGSAFAPGLPQDVRDLPPPFDVLAQQASLEGLSSEALDRFRARAVPEPGPVLRQTVELGDDARTMIPTTLCAARSRARRFWTWRERATPCSPRSRTSSISTSSTCRPVTGRCGAVPVSSPRSSTPRHPA
jgi:hypothetical protein